MERERITREELMERLFHDDYENLKGKKLRMTRVRVPGKEVCMAHIISRSDGQILWDTDSDRRIDTGTDSGGRSSSIF